MEEDPIMQELRQIRRDLLKEAGGDLGKLLERADREGPALWHKYRKIVLARSQAASSTKPAARRKPNAFRSSKAKSRKV